jgi:hypothetical protein
MSLVSQFPLRNERCTQNFTKAKSKFVSPFSLVVELCLMETKMLHLKTMNLHCIHSVFQCTFEGG